MTFVDGFLTPVPLANKDAYIAHAKKASEMFKEFGVTRFVEAWGDDVPDGKTNDLKKSVNLEDGEAVLFSWFEYPDKATRDAIGQKMMTDPRMAEMSKDMPFDGKRMIYGGFEAIVDAGAGNAMGYLDGYVLPVPADNKDAYRKMAEKCAGIFQEYGATRVLEAWEADVPDGKVTDYNRATLKKDGENVVYSWVEWPDKATRDAAWPKIMEDERMKPDEGKAPFDGQRMMWGGFAPIIDDVNA